LPSFAGDTPAATATQQKVTKDTKLEAIRVEANFVNFVTFCNIALPGFAGDTPAATTVDC